MPNRQLIHKYSDCPILKPDGKPSYLDSEKGPLHRILPAVATAALVLTGCGSSEWSNGIQRAIAIIPGVNMVQGLPRQDEALGPGYNPGAETMLPTNIVVADQTPIMDTTEKPETAPAMKEPAAAPAPATTIDAPVEEALFIEDATLNNTLLGRLQKLESDLSRLDKDFQEIRPSIERLMAIEADLDELVDQLFLLVAQGPDIIVPGGPSPPIQQKVNVAPITRIPVGDGGPPATSLNPRPSITVGSATPANGQFALHLASYRLHNNAILGWNELKTSIPSQLSDLLPGTSTFSKGQDGQFIRLKAGPLNSEMEAEARCQVIQAAGRYCTVMAYQGTMPF